MTEPNKIDYPAKFILQVINDAFNMTVILLQQE